MPNSLPEDPFYVLIAGDDADERQAVGSALLLAGLSVQWEEVSAFANTWECLKQCPFDAVLVCFGEIEMFLSLAKDRGAGTPLILLTKEDDSTAPVNWIKAGASDLIPKSKVSPESLARALQNARRLHRAHTQIRDADTARRESEARWRSVSDSNTIGIVFWEADGTLSDANDAYLALLGYSRGDLEQGKINWRAITPPEYQASNDAKVAELIQFGTCAPWETEFMRPDGSRVALLVTASFLEPPDRRGLAFVVDITERKWAQDAQTFLAEAGAALSASPRYTETLAQVARLAVPRMADWCAVHLTEDGALTQVAQAHGEHVSEDDALAFAHWLADVPGTQAGLAGVLQTGRADCVLDVPAECAALAPPPALRSFLCAPIIARDEALGVITLAFASGSGQRHAPRFLPVAEQLGHRIGLAVDNARLLFETQARAEREMVVNAIGQTLRASLDADQILLAATQGLGKVLQASRCFWCWQHHAQGTMTMAPQQYAAPGIPLREQPGFSPEAISAQEPRFVVVRDFEIEFQSALPGDGTGRGDMQSFIACPVPLRGEWSGFLVAEQAGRARRWTASEAALVAQVGGLLSPALENARLYEHEHRVADMLQGAFLSNVPDQMSDLELATVYRAGLDESQVGGDCYDVFPLPDGRVALLIADVSGKGLSAAVLTATVKFSLRAFAAEVAAPSLVLTRLNKMLCGEASGLGEHFVTLFYAVFDPTGGRLIYASAGHETQIIKRASGGCTLLESTGPILGIAEHLFEQQEEHLKRADALILFTDGLTEARNPQTRELLDVRRVMGLLDHLPAHAGAGAVTARLEQLAREWAQGRPHDDMALLVARRVPLITAGASERVWDFAPRGIEDNREMTTLGTECLFRLTFPSRAGHAADVRQAVAHWMDTLGFDRAARDGFLTAVTEAVTNAVLHGSPAGEADQFSVAAFRAPQEHLAVEVTDCGPGLDNWDISPPMPGPEAVHGRGLPLMREFTDQVEYLPTDTGLCVRLHTSRL